MKWQYTDSDVRIPIRSWCAEVEASAMKQAKNLANHPATTGHVALMPDCHVGYGMPIGGVIACRNAVIPNAVGVDIGCGMCAVRTDIPCKRLAGNLPRIRQILDFVKKTVPVGEAHGHSEPQNWTGLNVFAARVRPDSGEFASLLDSKETPWVDARCLELARKNLGTLGGGNHFIEIQAGDDGNVWLMIHSGSRNLGYRIASHYHRLSVTLNRQEQRSVPDEELAYLDAESEEGIAYVRDMNFALEYAFENRRRIMTRFKSAIESIVPDTRFEEEINIHHNYAGLEEWNGTSLWIHRKGATSAKKGEYGIIPGSMGTPSYIVRGLGNPDSFQSCSHGAGRAMGRNDACRRLSVKECDRSMEGIVFDRWQLLRDGGKKNRGREKLHDLAEAPLAYKDIETVIESERDLAEPAIRLRPLGVVKG